MFSLNSLAGAKLNPPLSAIFEELILVANCDFARKRHLEVGFEELA